MFLYQIYSAFVNFYIDFYKIAKYNNLRRRVYEAEKLKIILGKKLFHQ